MSAPVYTSPVESWAPSAEDLDRFWSKVRKGNCWRWVGDSGNQIRWGAFGTRESVLRVSFFIQHGVWPMVPVRRDCETEGCLRHLALADELEERARRVYSEADRVDPPLESVLCTHCGKQKPQTNFYKRKGGGFVQPCRNCYQARAKKRDAKAAEIMAKRNVAPGACCCGCLRGAHRSDGKGPCSCGKCPSFYERGL